MKRRDCGRMELRVPRKYLRDSRGRFVSLMQMLQASRERPKAEVARG